MTEKAKVSGNPAAVEFPQDKYGATRNLRSAGLAAAARVSADKEKLKVYIETLDVLKEHAIARFKKDAEQKKKHMENARARNGRAAEEAEQRRQQQLSDLEKQAAALMTDAEKEAKGGA